MNVENLIQEIRKSQEDMNDALRKNESQILIPLFSDYTEDIIRLVKNEANKKSN